MTNPRLLSKHVEKLASDQMEGMKQHPELAAKLPYSVAMIEAMVAEYQAMVRERGEAKTLAKLLTKSLAMKRFDLRANLLKNIAAAQSTLGKYADELADLGGKPLKGIHPAKPPADEKPPGSDAPGKDTPSA